MLRPKLQCSEQTAPLKDRAGGAQAALSDFSEQGQVFLDHAPRQFRDIGLVEIVGILEIDFLDVEEFPVPFDLVTNVVAIDFGPGF